MFIGSPDTNATIKIKAVKLELGPTQTLCHNEGTESSPIWVLNEIPDYETELLRCISSKTDNFDTYSNKTVATTADIATAITNAIGGSY